MTELAQEGANVAICARTATTVVEAAVHIQKTACHEVLHRALDVTDSAAVAAFVSPLKVRLCLVDICVTNCDSPPSNIFKNTPPEARRRTRPASDEHHLFRQGNSAADAEE